DSVAAREVTRKGRKLGDPQGYAVADAAFAGGDETYADGWKDVAGPALFLTGADDPNSMPVMATQMAELAPRGDARSVEGHR
ncbi:alpha/beta hydrolase, partial [Rhizobium johnstonii]